MYRALAILLTTAISATVASSAEPSNPAAIGFREEIAPILVSKCLGCHHDGKPSGGLSLRTFASLRNGGKGRGAEIILPGRPDESALIEAIGPEGSPRMPLKQPPLSDSEIKKLSEWIKQGAKFDGGSETEVALSSLVDPLKGLRKIPVKAPVSDPIAAVAFSPDGSRVAVAFGKSVEIRDAKSGAVVETISDHPGPVTSLKYAPDGRILVICGGRAGVFGSIVARDLASKSTRYEIRGHSDTILSADVSTDGKLLATSSYDRMIRIWDLKTGAAVRTLKEHTDAVYSAAFTPDGKRLASGAGDRTVKLWDVASGRRLASLGESTAEVYAVAFGADGKRLFAAGVDRSIRVWSINGENAILADSAFAHDAPILRLTIPPGGKRLFSSSEDRTIKAWDPDTLKPIKNLAVRSDWPLSLAVSPVEALLAAGGYDGTLDLLNAEDGSIRRALRTPPRSAPPASPSAPPLVRNASLNPLSPRGVTRGRSLKSTLTGTGAGDAESILFLESGIVAKILRAAKPDANRVEVELKVEPDARPGVHRIGLRAPLGVTGFQPFHVSEYPEVAEVEPNDAAPLPAAIAWPATLSGTLDKPGDVDQWRFAIGKGRSVSIETYAKRLGSSLSARVSLLDEARRELASADSATDASDPALSWTSPIDQTVTLRIEDLETGGSGNHFYRIDVSTAPFVESIFPLGLTAGKAAKIEVVGTNLGGTAAVSVAADRLPPGGVASISVGRNDASRVKRPWSAIVEEGPSLVEVEDNDSVPKAMRSPAPSGVSGRIDKPGDVDHFKFAAKKGRRLLVEVQGRRLGSPIDSAIEILDEAGRPIPRALLRPVDETQVAFRDHGSSGRGMRLTNWDRLAAGDVMLVGRELTRITALPRNPDDDAIFFGLGGERLNLGERVGLLETTPEQHPMNQPMYKVEVHPPGATFPAGGVPPVTLFYRNDDGGPGFGKDSRLTFDPPADGNYVVRVEDVPGTSGPDAAYHLVIREPRPNFRLSLGAENPNIPRGGGTIVSVNLIRLDGFDGPVDVTVEGLPSGVTATSARIQSESTVADLLLMADATAPAFSPPTWKVRARAVSESSGTSASTELVREIDPGGPMGGFVTVTPEPDLKIRAAPDRVTIRPGERVEMTLHVERSPAFKGRVPIDVRNLPRGVRVLFIGLNGVLVTEVQKARSIFLYAEPWVELGERPFFAVGKVEAGGTEHSSAPIPLMVLPGGDSGKARERSLTEKR